MDLGESRSRPARFGPYHRAWSPTQDRNVFEKQIASSEIWGTARLGTGLVCAKAYDGPLPEGVAGIEFYTEVPPDLGVHPLRPTWSGPRPGVRVEGEYAKIACVIVLVRQSDE